MQLKSEFPADGKGVWLRHPENAVVGWNTAGTETTKMGRQDSVLGAVNSFRNTIGTKGSATLERTVSGTLLKVGLQKTKAK